MTYTELCIAVGSISVLLIGWLMIYLRKDFAILSKPPLTDKQKFMMEAFAKLGSIDMSNMSQEKPLPTIKPGDEIIFKMRNYPPYESPKRRKWRDNKGEVLCLKI